MSAGTTTHPYDVSNHASLDSIIEGVDLLKSYSKALYKPPANLCASFFAPLLVKRVNNWDD
jgi:hypothetical protein